MKNAHLLLAAAMPVLAAAPVAAQEALAQKSGCLACHAIDKRVVGPAYKDVAEKYRGDETAQAKLEKKVKEGGVGVWGDVPMPPNSFVSDADIKSLVSWVLSQK